MFWWPFAFFVVLTACYFFIKPPRSKIYYLLYFPIMLAVQSILSILYLRGTCGAGNILGAVKLTVLPWCLLFGVLLFFLHKGGDSVSEGLKSPFANVFGYLWLSGKADKVLRDILNKNDTDVTASLIEKIYGNPSLLINHLTPSNFEQHWINLKTLMKSPEDEMKRDSLLDIVYSRDMIGEAAWYFYTGFLTICMVEFQLSNYKCVTSVAVMNQQYQDYKNA